MEEKWLDRKLLPLALVVSGILLLVIATMDSLTRYELALAPFYLLPIALAAWFGGYRWGTLGASLALATWLVADRISGHVYSRPLYAFWSGADRGMAFFAFMIAVVWLSQSQRRLQESNRALQKSEQHFWSLFNNSDVAMFRSRLNGSETLECNEKFLEVVGRTRDEVIGSPTVLLWEKPQAREQMVRQLIAEGRVTDLEFGMVRPSGEVRRCMTSLRLFSQDGVVEGLIQDITERKQAEEALSASEEKFSKTFRSAPILAALSCFENGQLIDVNDLYCQILGFTREELIGRTTIELGIVHQDERERMLGIVEEIGRAKNIEHELYTKNGQRIPCLFSGETFSIGEQKILISMVTDITELRRVEQHERNLEAQLQQSQKMESLGTLVAGVAHNINNVLSVIMGMASLREDSATEPCDKEAYQIIGKVCKRGRDVVKSLIRFAKPDITNQGPFEVHSLIKEVCALLDRTIRNQVKIIESFSEDSLWINGDAGSINHVLVNLCLNAVDAMPNGGTLTLRTTVKEENWVEVTIEDTGIGMTPEVLVHVMEPFYTTKEVGKGTGLGLSMTYGVVKAHGGTIDIASKVGMGTTVRLLFPRVATPISKETVDVPAPTLKLKRVLLVDDEEDVRFLMTRMLRTAGIEEVETTSTGEEALETLLEGELPDVLILDQNMPGITGVQLMARVRDRYPDLPILFSSGQPDIESWEILKQRRVAVISKPFTMEEILAKLAQFAHGPIPGQ